MNTERYRILSGSTLKVIAMILMIIDHTALHVLSSSCSKGFTVFGNTIYLYEAMRWIGRLSFPIFAFLLVEGFIVRLN